jgi:hypothetical protein
VPSLYALVPKFGVVLTAFAGFSGVVLHYFCVPSERRLIEKGLWRMRSHITLFELSLFILYGFLVYSFQYCNFFGIVALFLLKCFRCFNA